MAGINKVIIVGHLGNDPEMRSMPNGEAVANISVATSEAWTDKNTGERREVTEWHRIVFYRKLAEICGQDRYTTEIQGDVMQMLGTRPQSADGANNSQPMPQQDASANAFDDSIPF